MSKEVASARLTGVGSSEPLRPLSQRAYRDLSNNAIYALTDPADDVIRYIGFTTQAPEARRRQHMKLARHRSAAGDRYPVINWIQSLAREGREPNIVVLETFVDDWESRERFWIQFLRGRGQPLLNVKDGGQPGHKKGSSTTGQSMSLETRAKISDAARKRYKDPEERAKASERMQGTMRSAETRAKLTKTHCPAGHEYTPENSVVYSGRKECRACRKAAGARYRAEKKAGVSKPRKIAPTHCPANHEYTPDNTAYDKGSKSKRCRTCRRERRAAKRSQRH